MRRTSPLRRARPREPVGAAGCVSGARARADPLRAHARVAVHLLPRRRPGHGVRPGHDAHLGSHDPDLRRRTPQQLRTVRVPPERSIMFDVNDFDETLPGPWEWDLKRLAASVVIAGRDGNFSKKDCAIAAQEVGDVPAGDASPGRVAQPRRVVLAYRRGGGHRRPHRPGHQTGVEERCAHGDQGVLHGRQVAHEGLAAGPGQADRGRRGPAPDHQRPPAHRPPCGAFGGAPSSTRCSNRSISWCAAIAAPCRPTVVSSWRNSS